MLVLSRKLNQQICIGDRITVTVLEIRGNRVRLGIEAPAEVPVFRQELLDKCRLSQDEPFHEPVSLADTKTP